jgi:uncharacterized protein
MKYNKFGKTELVISEIGFGGLHIATKLNASQAHAVLEHALKCGINFFDTSRAYKDSESKIGECFKKYRKDVILCTKSFIRNKLIIKEFQESLKNLKTDYVDIFMFHGVDHEKDFNEICNASYKKIVQQKEKGKIRHIGISSHSSKIAKIIIDSDLFDCIQFPLNLLNQQFINDGLDQLLIKKQMGFLAMKPFSGGVLNNAELSINYIRQYDWAVPLIGFENKKEIDDILNIYKSAIKFGIAEKKKVQQINDEIGKIFCRGCEYCMPCPLGINTGFLMYYPIQLKQFGLEKLDHVTFKMEFDKFNGCSQCKKCETRCPFELPILELISQYRKEYIKLISDEPIS